MRSRPSGADNFGGPVLCLDSCSSSLSTRAQERAAERGGSRAREDRRVIFEPGLIRRIESSSARVTMATAAAFADRAAGAPARAVAFAGGTLAAFGPGRYVNRAVGVSLDDLDDDQLDELEPSSPPPGCRRHSKSHRGRRPPSWRGWRRGVHDLVVPQRVRGSARRPAAAPPSGDDRRRGHRRHPRGVAGRAPHRQRH